MNDVIHSQDCPHYPSEGNVRTEFRKTLNTEIAKHPELARELASQFQVADSTVVRWETGTAYPHPLTIQVILDFIKQKTG